MTRKERAEFRRANRLCMQCAAGLQETDIDYCVECTQIRAEARARYEQRNPNRSNRMRKNPLTPEYIAEVNRRRREERERRKISGQCVSRSCPNPAWLHHQHCKYHLRMTRKASREHQRRRAAKLATGNAA